MNARVERLAAQAAGAAADRLAAAIRADVPGVSVARTERGIEITGRDLGARLAREPGLRWPAGLIR